MTPDRAANWFLRLVCLLWLIGIAYACIRYPENLLAVGATVVLGLLLIGIVRLFNGPFE